MAAGPASLVQVSLADFAPTSEVATFNVVDGVTGAADSQTADVTSVAGGAFVGRKGTASHGRIVCWRVQGAYLELSEVSVVRDTSHADVAMAAPDRAELSLRFPAPLVPEVSLAQLADDSLLISAVTHSAAGGGYVYQLRFPCTRGAHAGRSFWLLRPEPVVLTKYGFADQIVGGKLGRLRVARFGSPREEGGLVLQLCLLGGCDALSIVEMRTSFAAREIETPEVMVTHPKSRWSWGCERGLPPPHALSRACIESLH